MSSYNRKDSPQIGWIFGVCNEFISFAIISPSTQGVT